MDAEVGEDVRVGCVTDSMCVKFERVPVCSKLPKLSPHVQATFLELARCKAVLRICDIFDTDTDTPINTVHWITGTD
jgi:hypothetical protein